MHGLFTRDFYIVLFIYLNSLIDHVLQEFNIEKLQFIEAEKAKVRKEYERKEQQIDVKKKM